MSALRLFALAWLCSTLFFAGCKTTGDSSGELRRLGGLVEVAAFTGTSLRLADKPGDRMKFEVALATLRSMETNGVFNPLLLQDVMRDLGVNELKDPRAAIFIGSATILYDQLAGDSFRLDQTPLVRVVVPRLAAGIERGLGSSPSPVRSEK